MVVCIVQLSIILPVLLAALLTLPYFLLPDPPAELEQPALPGQQVPLVLPELQA